MSEVDISERLVADELKVRAGGQIIGRDIFVLEETSSTNDAILQMAGPGTQEGLVVFAEHQSAGRGRRGNRWESAAHKGLWFSLLLRPQISLDESARLTTWAAQTIVATIENELSLKAVIKAPNDVYINGRKVAGVLVEMRAQKKAPHLAITGIGINVNQAPEDFSPELRSRATSLAIAVDRQVDRTPFAAALLRILDQTYRETFAS